jgi:PncC family amidohydrolase
MAIRLDRVAIPELVATIDAAVRARGRSVAIAESCTGGAVAAAITDRPGVSSWFRGSAVTYATAAKYLLLGVDPLLIDRHGPASEPVARAMAVAARLRYEADLSVSITGVAGPDPDERGVAPGSVWIGWATATANGVLIVSLRGDRGDVRRGAVAMALSVLIEIATPGDPLPRLAAW